MGRREAESLSSKHRQREEENWKWYWAEGLPQRLGVPPLRQEMDASATMCLQKNILTRSRKETVRD